MEWVALFSQTGSEILEVSKKLGRFPDRVITNNQDITTINDELRQNAVMWYCPKKPTVDEYLSHLPKKSLVTMHGWLRIVPGEVCEQRNIYNGHPGLITEFPELKGKDPQQKAIDLGLWYSGCILHEATAELDGGPIIDVSDKVSIKGKTADNVFADLHAASVQLWVKFLTKKLNERN